MANIDIRMQQTSEKANKQDNKQTSKKANKQKVVFAKGKCRFGLNVHNFICVEAWTAH